MKKGSLKGLIFLQLKEGDSSGYELMKNMKLQTGKKPSPGSIYPILSELKEEGLIKFKEVGRTKQYSLTLKGKNTVENVIEEKKNIILMEINLIEKIENLTCKGCKDDNMDFLKNSYELMDKSPIELFKIYEHVFRVKKELVDIVRSKKLDDNREEITKIIDEAVKKLERIKKRK